MEPLSAILTSQQLSMFPQLFSKTYGATIFPILSRFPAYRVEPCEPVFRIPPLRITYNFSLTNKRPKYFVLNNMELGLLFDLRV